MPPVPSRSFLAGSPRVILGAAQGAVLLQRAALASWARLSTAEARGRETAWLRRALGRLARPEGGQALVAALKLGGEPHRKAFSAWCSVGRAHGRAREAALMRQAERMRGRGQLEAHALRRRVARSRELLVLRMEALDTESSMRLRIVAWRRLTADARAREAIATEAQVTQAWATSTEIIAADAALLQARLSGTSVPSPPLQGWTTSSKEASGASCVGQRQSPLAHLPSQQRSLTPPIRAVGGPSVFQNNPCPGQSFLSPSLQCWPMPLDAAPASLPLDSCPASSSSPPLHCWASSSSTDKASVTQYVEGRPASSQAPSRYWPTSLYTPAVSPDASPPSHSLSLTIRREAQVEGLARRCCAEWTRELAHEFFRFWAAMASVSASCLSRRGDRDIARVTVQRCVVGPLAKVRHCVLALRAIAAWLRLLALGLEERAAGSALLAERVCAAWQTSTGRALERG